MMAEAAPRASAARKAPAAAKSSVIYLAEALRIRRERRFGVRDPSKLGAVRASQASAGAGGGWALSPRDRRSRCVTKIDGLAAALIDDWVRSLFVSEGPCRRQSTGPLLFLEVTRREAELARLTPREAMAWGIGLRDSRPASS